jgi:kinesin family protein 5
VILQGGAFSEKEEQLRATLAKLDSVDANAAGGALTSEDLTLLRRQLGEQQTLVRETLDRLAQAQEENEHIARRRDELEQRLQTLEAEYEELLGTCGHTPLSVHSHTSVEKTIHDEENSNLDIADSMAELKVK